MTGRGWLKVPIVPALLGWLLVLALLPWWLGLSLLLSLAAVVTFLERHLTVAHAMVIRRAMHWGLPGMLFALQRALGGDVYAWGAALLGALAGYTMLAGLEAWLDRELRRAPAAEQPSEWSELALAPIGPPAQIIELTLPRWQVSADEPADPLGGHVRLADGRWCFDIGGSVPALGRQLAFSPGGRWCAVRMEHGRGVLLWDRQREKQRRLRGWHLAGWYRDQPWLQRREESVPLALSAVLGEDDEGDA